MSKLTLALDRIMIWLQKYQPDFANTFLPGLTRSEIEEMTHNLPGQIPEEIYELYQWRNGVRDENLETVVYPSPGFLPLDEAVQVCEDLIDSCGEEDPLLFEGQRLFPFLRENCSHCAVLLDADKQQFSPVIDIADELDLRLMYRSLTSMMMTLAEYCEMGGYYIGEVDEKSGGKADEACGFIRPDESKMIPTFQKYNPGIRFFR
jgi:cell wall assembly regulator SMI1